MNTSIIDLTKPLKYLADTNCARTYIAIVDSKESDENQRRLSRWTRGIKTPTDTAPREDIQIERLSEHRIAIAVPDDFPLLLTVLSHSRVGKPTAWVYIQKSTIEFPDKTRYNGNIPGGATVKTGPLGDSTYYVAAQANDMPLALEAIADASADPRGAVNALLKLAAEQAPNQRQ